MTFTRQDVQGPMFLRTTRTILALMLREMSSTYGRTPGGYIWAVLQPVAGIALMTIVWSYGLRIKTPGIGTSFALFFATGSLPFQMYSKLAETISRALVFSRALLAYPGVTFMDALLARFFLQLATKLMVNYLILAGILTIFTTGAILNYSAILNAMCMTAVLGFGIGCINAYLRPVYPVWDTFWSILNTPLYFLSCIFFMFDHLPALGKKVLWYNPLVHIVGEMRRGFYSNYRGDYITPSYVYGVGLGLTVLGLLLLKRHYKDVTNL